MLFKVEEDGESGKDGESGEDCEDGEGGKDCKDCKCGGGGESGEDGEGGGVGEDGESGEEAATAILICSDNFNFVFLVDCEVVEDLTTFFPFVSNGFCIGFSSLEVDLDLAV